MKLGGELIRPSRYLRQEFIEGRAYSIVRMKIKLVIRASRQGGVIQ